MYFNALLIRWGSNVPIMRRCGSGLAIVRSVASDVSRRRDVLVCVDMELSKSNERAALALVKALQGVPGGLRCFGTARQIPQRLYTLDELKLNGIDAPSLLSPVDATLGAIERNLQIVAVLAVIATWTTLHLNMLQFLLLSLGFFTLRSVDLVLFDDGIRSLVLDTIGHTLSSKYHSRVIQHEAGHFLVAYLLGVLPKGYTLSSLEAWRNEGSLNVQAGTTFVDFEFLDEVNSGKVSAKMLNKFSCIALAGIATEYLLFGLAEGGLADINELDRLLKGLGFTQKKADSQVRWAVLNTVMILRRHEGARSNLAEAMSMGKSVGSCIDIIEQAIDIDI